MAENYYYSSLSGDEIEQTLLGAVRFNTDQNLTTSQKAAARANIGAGESNSTFKILGYFDTLQDLQEWLQILPEPGDAYGIGTSSPYDIYVWDGAHSTWVNNGPIVLSDALIDDEDISTDHTWSSTKISTKLSGKQNKITANGILKGNGSGGVSAAVAGTDYLTPATNYSPWSVHDGVTSYSIVADDAGKTIRINYNCTITLSQAVSQAMPNGTEIGLFCGATGADAHILLNIPDGRTYGRATRFTSVKLNGICSMNVIKKAWGNTWFVTGPDVEVVS